LNLEAVVVVVGVVVVVAMFELMQVPNLYKLVQ
jgi:hypothetical protein